MPEPYLETGAKGRQLGIRANTTRFRLADLSPAGKAKQDAKDDKPGRCLAERDPAKYQHTGHNRVEGEDRDWTK